jgi:hypothetical protein
MKALKTFNLVPTQRRYLIAGTNPGELNWQNLKKLDDGSIFVITRAADGAKAPLAYMPWSKWRQQYALTSTWSGGPPSAFTITPDGYLEFNATPDAADTIELPYWKTAQTLAADGDEPEGVEDDLHMVIVWRTVIRFATPKGALTLASYASTKEFPLYSKLMTLHLPAVECGPNPIT